MAGAEAFLSVSNLTKRFAGLTAVNQVSFEVERGEFLAIIGPNGAGKTTLFNLITQYIQADEGRVVFDGNNLVGMTPEKTYRRKIGRTFQLTHIFKTLTVYENLSASVLAAHRKAFKLFTPASLLLRDKVIELAEEVGLSDQIKKEAGLLSYGDQKRLEIAIALSNEPILLFLDEPMGGLAPDEGIPIMKLIHNLNRLRNMTTIFIEHDMDMVFGFAKRIIVLNFGQMIADAKPEAIQEDEEVQRLYLGQHCTTD